MVSQQEIFEKMPGLGPHIDEPVTGRHGGSFSSFGDYSVSLFSHIDYSDEGKHRSLFDMAAVAIVKDPTWATASVIPAPIYTDGQWVERPGNTRKSWSGSTSTKRRLWPISTPPLNKQIHKIIHP